MSLTVVQLGCSDAEGDIPPYEGGCVNHCGSGSGTVGGGAGGSNDGGGSGGGNSSTRVDVEGTILAFTDSTFRTAQPYTGGAVVYAEGQTGDGAVFDGTGFQLLNVVQSANAWAAVVPDDGAAFYPTLSYTDTSAEALELPLVRRSVLEEIYRTLPLPSELASGTAHVVLRVTDTTGEGATGVQLGPTAAEFVAYSQGGTFTDLTQVTDNEGLIVVGHLPAPDLPGNNVVLRFSGAASGQITVRVARDFVTLASVQVR